jgi:hypothetical protein
MSEKHRNGGRARAAKLSPERRKEIAQSAARARWALPKPGAAYLKEPPMMNSFEPDVTQLVEAEVRVLREQVKLLQEVNANQANTISQLCGDLARTNVAARQSYELHAEYLIALTIKNVNQGWVEAGRAAWISEGAQLDAEALLRSSMRSALQERVLQGISVATPTHRHKKGALIAFLGYGRHSETGEELAFYRYILPTVREPRCWFWARPKAMFDETDRFIPIDAEKPGG